MRKRICYFGIAVIVVGLILVTGCAQKGASPTQAESQAATADSAIVSEPGYYEDKTIGYSVKYLANIFTVENELEPRDLELGIVLFREHAQKVPSIVIRAQDKPEGVALENVGEWFKKDLEAFHVESDRFKVIESNMVKLQTGVDANATLMKWRYQGAVPVYTAVVIAYKSDNPNVTRRHFLKATGAVLLVAGTGCQFSTGQRSRSDVEKILADTTLPPSDGYIIVDTKKCQGCVTCMLACSLVHEGVHSLSLSRIQVLQHPFNRYPDDLTIEQCRQCVDPPCVEACPESALTVNSDFGNVRMVDAEKCVGCGTCVEACPYTPTRPILAADERFENDLKARKCDLCAHTPYHWDKKGGGPDGKQACVEVCPVGAIQFTREIPIQEGDTGYKVNLRDANWARLGFPIN